MSVPFEDLLQASRFADLEECISYLQVVARRPDDSSEDCIVHECACGTQLR